jgi:hypothetical protein
MMRGRCGEPVWCPRLARESRSWIFMNGALWLVVVQDSPTV